MSYSKFVFNSEYNESWAIILVYSAQMTFNPRNIKTLTIFQFPVYKIKDLLLQRDQLGHFK